MFVTLVSRSLSCFEQIVTDSNQSNITFQSCMRARSAVPNGCQCIQSTTPTGRLQRYKCAPDHHELDVKL
jgi:hypothetical protein